MTDSGGSTASPGRVLLIDDDRVFGMWATKVLQARGFDITHVLDPVNGLKQIEAEPWDLVITDVEMPRMSGMEFLERARSLDPGLPVAVVTAHPTVDRAVTTLRHAGTEFIQKPITPEDFVVRVTALAGQRTSAPAAAKESVLAIGAHPGDVEIGAGGALLAHRAAGAEVTLLSMAPLPAAATDGGQQEDGSSPLGTRVRIEELTGGPNPDAVAIQEAIGTLAAQVQPTVVYLHSSHDREGEHRDAHLAGMTAAGNAERVYCFQSPSATLTFHPAHVVAIDDHVADKLKAVEAFAALPEVGGYLEAGLVVSTARYWARYCGARHAEAFEVMRDRAASEQEGARQVTAQAAS
jgi:CheY-like chemotaxis protein